MDNHRIDQLSKVLAAGATRRTALGAFAALGLAGASGRTIEAKHKHKHKHKKGNGGLGLGEICTKGKDTCEKGLKCDSPTTRHTCSGTVEGIDTWCCVPPGGKCSECDCCGDFYCDFGDANPEGACIPNPEG
jgi:hypothetical protein